MNEKQQALIKLHLPLLLKKKDRPLKSLAIVAKIVSFLLYNDLNYYVIYREFEDVVGAIYLSPGQFNEVLQLIDMYYVRPEFPETRTFIN
jgi:hypothetical protein